MESNLQNELINVFRQLDADGDDYVSETDVDRLVVYPHRDSLRAAAVALLKTDFERIARLHRDGPFAAQFGVSFKDLLKLIELLKVEDTDSDIEAADLKRRANELVNRTDFLSSHPFTLYGVGGAKHCVRPQSIAQGVVGNCTFMAALASVSAVSPETIFKTIADNGNGYFTVTFRGALSTPLVVSEPTLVERALYCSETKFGGWPAILEKAYGCYRRSTAFNPKSVDADNTAGARYWHEIFALLTGQSATLVKLESSSAGMVAEIFDRAFEERRAVCAWSSPSSEELICAGPIPSSHGYGVIEWSSKTRRVTVYNPWGAAEGAEPVDTTGKAQDGLLDGVFSLDIDQFCIKFDHLHVEQWSDGATILQHQAPESVALNRSARNFAMKLRIPLCLTVMLLAIGAGASVSAQAWSQICSQNWRETTAKLYIPGQTISAPRMRDDAIPYMKEFDYYYSVNGRNYLGRDNLSFADLAYENDELLNARHGQIVKITYDPQNPSESALRPGIHLVQCSLEVYVFCAAGLVAFLDFALLLLSLVEPEEFRSRGKRRGDILIINPLLQDWIPRKWRSRILSVLSEIV